MYQWLYYIYHIFLGVERRERERQREEEKIMTKSRFIASASNVTDVKIQGAKLFDGTSKTFF